MKKQKLMICLMATVLTLAGCGKHQTIDISDAPAAQKAETSEEKAQQEAMEIEAAPISAEAGTETGSKTKTPEPADSKEEAVKEAVRKAETPGAPVTEKPALLHPFLYSEYQCAQDAQNMMIFELVYPKISLPADEQEACPELEESFLALSKKLEEKALEDRTVMLENSADLPGAGSERPQLVSHTDLHITRADTEYVCLRLDGYSYFGGAHGGALVDGYAYDTKTGKRLCLEDMISDKDAFIEEIKKRLEKNYPQFDYPFGDRKTIFSNYSLGQPTGQGSPEQTWFSWIMEDEGIQVVFNQYEIASYAEGILTVDFNFKEDAKLFRKDFSLLPEDYISYRGEERDEYGYLTCAYDVHANDTYYVYAFTERDDGEAELIVYDASGSASDGKETASVKKLPEIGRTDLRIALQTDNVPVVSPPEAVSCYQSQKQIFPFTDPACFSLSKFDKVKGQEVYGEYKVGKDGMPELIKAG